MPEKADDSDEGRVRAVMSPFFISRPELGVIEEFFHRGGRFASITGLAGIGKTSLASALSHRGTESNLFPGGSMIFDVGSPFSLFAFYYEYRKYPVGERSLVILDDFDNSPGMERWITHALNENKALSILTTSRARGSFRYSPGDLHIPLGGFSEEQFYDFLSRRLGDREIAAIAIANLFDLAAGSPLFADVAARALRENLATFEDLIRSLQEFKHSGLLGPDGQPIRSDQLRQEIKIDIASANDLIYREISEDPVRMRLLTPSQFEEFVAEMLSKQGYEIEMTPSSSDGGFDMYAARKDGLGSFLFLVECKRYTPPNKVGVEIVRALHGVVQQSQANAGIVVTSSFFTKGSREFQKRVPFQLHLQDYVAMQMWLRRFEAGTISG